MGTRKKLPVTKLRKAGAEPMARHRIASAPARPFPGPADRRILDQINGRAREQGFSHTLPSSRRYVITAAQNATPVHREFFESLLKYCRHNTAALIVVPFRYRNPTSLVSEAQKDDDWWAAELAPYLFAGREMLNKNVAVMGDVRITPTRSDPLAGLDAMSYSASAIFAHTKVALRTVASPGHSLPKILTTTGAVTIPNYVDALAPKIGEFHHSQAAVVVEIAGDEFYLRQINASKETGEFTDLGNVYGPSDVRAAERPLALILGDTHVGFVDPGVQEATFGTGGMVQALRPEKIVYHDLLDGFSCNPHHNGNPFSAIAKRASGLDRVKEEIEAACRYVKHNTPDFARAVVVASNHDDFLRRWIFQTDWRQDPTNAVTYLRTALEMAEKTTLTPSGTEVPSPFRLWAEKLMPGVRLLGGDESLSLAGVELGMHGDRGPNGSRGSIKNLRRVGTKIVIGHSHSPGINEGAFQTGTSSLLRLEYNSGPSSWAHAHVVLYASGKRSLLFMVGKNWRLE